MRLRMVRCFIFVWILTVFFCVHNVSASASMKRSQLVGSIAPDFALETTADTKVALRDVNGHGVVLFFFTTWCPYCREKLPLLAAERQKMKEGKIELLLIDAGESKAKVKAFIEKQQLPFAVLLDVNTLVAESYGVVGVPTFVLISADGDVVWMGNELPDNYRKLLAR